MPVSTEQPVVLCISTYEKGQAFLEELARLGVDVLLLTVDKLSDASWPRESLKRLITMPEGLSPDQVLNTVTYLARWKRIDRIVALDEFDLETAALLREHMRLPGMGQSATFLFRDKLAMRQRARERSIRVPEFTGLFQHDAIHHFLTSTTGPWLLKPRTNASAVGISKIHHPDEIWPLLDALGDLASHYLLECFIPGDIFHVEGITYRGETLFSLPFGYGQPPMQTMHEGGVFTTRTLDRSSADAAALTAFHRDLLQALELDSGVTHSEFIRSRSDGSFYFLETAARVGGAYIAETVEFASGANPWVEWARLEFAALTHTAYALPPIHDGHAGSVISLARQPHPDTSAYTDSEIAMRLEKLQHAGLIVRSESCDRVADLVTGYSERFLEDFNAVLPVPDKPTS